MNDSDGGDNFLLTIFLTIMIQAVAIIENEQHFRNIKLEMESVRNEMRSQSDHLVSNDLQQSLQQLANRSERQDQFLRILQDIESGFDARRKQMDRILNQLPRPTPAVPLLPTPSKG